jgi:hypothetical protein
VHSSQGGCQEVAGEVALAWISRPIFTCGIPVTGMSPHFATLAGNAGIRHLVISMDTYQLAKRITHPDCEDVAKIRGLPCNGWSRLSADWYHTLAFIDVLLPSRFPSFLVTGRIGHGLRSLADPTLLLVGRVNILRIHQIMGRTVLLHLSLMIDQLSLNN